VTLGISSVAADLMLAVWTGITYQIGVPPWRDDAVKLPMITAIRGNGTAVMMTYPLYRLIVLAVAIDIGLWLMITRTCIGTARYLLSSTMRAHARARRSILLFDISSVGRPRRQRPRRSSGQKS
jgi:hypothetical protein